MFFINIIDAKNGSLRPTLTDRSRLHPHAACHAHQRWHLAGLLRTGLERCSEGLRWGDPWRKRDRTIRTTMDNPTFPVKMPRKWHVTTRFRAPCCACQDAFVVHILPRFPCGISFGGVGDGGGENVFGACVLSS